MTTTQTPRPPGVEQLAATRVLAVLRAGTSQHVEAAADALVDAGIECVELTLTVPGALGVLARLAEQLPERVAVGAGTVTTAEQARQAVAAGARFLVSPAVCADVIAVAVEQDVACYPGAWTPTEVLTAWRAGASAVKLFPAASGGPAHLRRLREPLPDVPLVPTGGIDLDQAPDYLAAGALAVGVGGPLLRDALDGGDLRALRDRARRLLDAVGSAR